MNSCKCSIYIHFDDLQCISETCDKKMLKGKILCQAVNNKYEIVNLPENVASIGRLEKALVAKPILFKKVAIICKRQSPKISGNVCNIPIENVFNNYNILPRAADSNGLLL